MADDPVQLFKNALRNSAQRAVQDAVDGAFGKQQAAPRQNPEPSDDDESEDGEEVDGLLPLAFDDPDPNDNLQMGAAAWRVLAEEGEVVARYKPTGCVFVGTDEELDQYAEDKGLTDGEWEVWDDADKILSLPYDSAGLRSVLEMLRTSEIDDAREDYEAFHWGEQGGVTEIKSIPGVQGPLVFLGLGDEITYIARKDGELAAYVHEFGEESGVRPSVYALGSDVLVIHGGHMHVEDRGIVD